jgi:cytochrome c oxidase subunit 3/cytochrome o ubiquinol oxidase subunit 3
MMTDRSLVTEEIAEEAVEAPSLGVDSQKMGIWTLLGSEAVFFGGLIITYLVNRGRGAPPHAHDVLDIGLTAVNTFVLLTSSMTMVLSFGAIQRGDKKWARNWLILTAILGMGFLSGQGFEFTKLYREGVTLSSNLFGSTFFTLTGFHGAHVFVGVIWILFVLWQLFAGKITQEHHIAVEVVGLYWHFVDIIWLILFTIIYLI